MNTDTAREDLAFLRALVQPDEGWQRSFGQTYAAAGLCYGVQIILHGLQGLRLMPGDAATSTVVGLGPTVVFLALFVWITRRNRGSGRGGVTSRAIASVFGAVGLANLALIALIGSVAWRERSLTIWLIYPCVVLVLQGAAWLVAYSLRRKGWFALVAAGWFATGLGMALAIETPAAFILIGAVGFFAFMLAPGLVLMRRSERPA